MADTKKSKQKPDTSNWTKPSQMRLKPDTLADLDFVMGSLGVDSRSDVVRILARQAARKLAKEKGDLH